MNSSIFSFKGRVGRKTYWIFVGIAVVLSYFFSLLDSIDEDSFTGVFFILLFFSLFFYWCWLAMLVKRCHDVGKSGWHIFLSIIPIIGPFWQLIVLGLREGEEGINIYGYPPGFSQNDYIESKVFFCFDYGDLYRANIVKDYWLSKGKKAFGFLSSSEFDQLENQGDLAVKNWINEQLMSTSSTVVLVGEKTSNNTWVKYAISQSIKKGNSLIGIDISKIKDENGNNSKRSEKMLTGYPFYFWNKDNGKENISSWIDMA